MALTKCIDCGKEISTKAYMCPGCGAMLKQENLFLRMVLLAIIALVITVLFFRLFEAVIYDWSFTIKPPAVP